MRSEINAGLRRGGTSPSRSAAGSKEFELYAPMALAGKMGIYDVPDTILSRTIIIPMQRRLEDGKASGGTTATTGRGRADPLDVAVLGRTRPQLRPRYVKPGRPVLPKGLWNRDADVWEPLLAVAELAGGHWPERARVAAVAGVAAAGGGPYRVPASTCWPTSRPSSTDATSRKSSPRTCWPN